MDILDKLKLQGELDELLTDFEAKAKNILLKYKLGWKEENKQNDWKLEMPFQRGDVYFVLQSYGGCEKQIYDDVNLHINNVVQGNAFVSEQLAELESKRRELITKFRDFQDASNRDWVPDFNHFDTKYFIAYDYDLNRLKVYGQYGIDGFHIFGYFQNERDAKQAIEIFGEQIKDLFVECD
jgi:hypothetical protein